MSINFYLLNSGYIFLLFGDTLYKIVIPLFVYEISKSPLNMAFIFSLSYIPYLFFSPIGGAIADAFDKRNAIIIGSIASFTLSLLLSLFIIFKITNLYLLYTLFFLISACFTLYYPILQSFIPNLIKKNNFAQANAVISSAENFISAFCPIISGIILIFISIKATLIGCTLLFLVALIFSALINYKNSSNIIYRKKRINLFKNIQSGFKFTIRHKVIFSCNVIFIFLNFSTALFFSNYIYFLKVNFIASSFQIGVSFSIIGIFGVLGSIVAKKIIDKLHFGIIILASSFFEIFGFLSIYYIKSNFYIIFSCFWGIVVFFSAISGVAYFTMRQIFVPEDFLGRVVACSRLISYSMIPVASVIGGYLVEKNIGYSNLAGISALISLIGIVIGFISPLRVEKKLPINNHS